MANTMQVITEAQFATTVEGLLIVDGWLFVHSRPALTSKGWRTALTGNEGFPDYIATREGRLIFIELKSKTGNLVPEQYELLYELSKVSSAEVYLWTPDDFEEMTQVLSYDYKPLQEGV